MKPWADMNKAERSFMVVSWLESEHPIALMLKMTSERIDADDQIGAATNLYAVRLGIAAVFCGAPNHQEGLVLGGDAEDPIWGHGG